MPRRELTGVEAKSRSEFGTPTGTLTGVLAATALRTPRVPPDMVVRPRLLEILCQGARRQLTLLSAPAGYGKTALVASWAELVEEPSTVMNMTMNDCDSSPVAFWAVMVEGLRSRGVDVSGVAIRGSSDLVDGLTIMRLAQRITLHDQPVVWVLDCDQASLPPRIGEGLHRLIETCAGRLRVILLTRTDPPLPLNRYRLAGLITEIRADDLAFTRIEVSALMQRAGLDLSIADLAGLQERTGGWPAGLKFAAMSLAGRSDTAQAIRELRGDTGNVAEYLMSEVLDKQPPELREFLLQTCLVDELDPGLVGALTGQRCDRRALDFMSHGNSFIEPIPGSPGCFRYQSLFREFLRSQLSFEKPAQVPMLHRAAAEWFAQNGQLLAAIRHAAAGQSWPMASHYFVEGLCFGSLLSGRRRTFLKGLFAHLPPEQEGADAAVTRAALALTEHDSGRCRSELDAAQTWMDQDDAPRSPAYELAVVVLEAVAASLEADLDAGLEAVLAAAGALEMASVSDAAAYRELKAVVAGCEGRVFVQRGDFAAALGALTEGIRAAASPDLAGLFTQLQGMAALVEAMTGNLRLATERTTRWGSQPDDIGTDAVANSRALTLAIAWVRTDQYNLQAAWDLVGYAEEATSSYDVRVLAAISALLRARLLRAQGEFELARAVLRAARSNPPSGHGGGWLDHSIVFGQATSLLAEGHPEEAIAMVRGSEGDDRVGFELLVQKALLASGRDVPTVAEMSSTSNDTAPLYLRVSRLLVLAERSLRRHDFAYGEACLDRALRLAAPEQLRRPFFEADDHVRGLLERSGLAARHRWLQTRGSVPRGDIGVGRVVEQSHSWGEGDRGRGVNVVNPLTPKEQEVLGYLAQLLSTDEIAEAMFVSVNTVRSHVRGILRKLGVARRNEAVRRAWELRLLGPHRAA